MSITAEILKENQFKHLVSFAIWDFESYEYPNGYHYDTAVKKLNEVKSQEEIDELNLNADTAIIGLNYATFGEGMDTVPDYANFHLSIKDGQSSTSYKLPTTGEQSSKSLHNDERLGYALYNTSAWGGIMLDLMCRDKNGDFLGFPESKSNVAASELKDENMAKLQLEGVIKILQYFNSKNPRIICLGGDVYQNMNKYKNLVVENLGNETQIIKATHYATTTGKSHNEFINEILRTEIDG